MSPAATDLALDPPARPGRTTPSTTPAPAVSPAPGARPAPPTLLGWDGVEWWVGNARSSAAFWCQTFGFEVLAYAGPETGVRDRVSYVVGQGAMRMTLTAATDASSPIALHHLVHGDGVKDLAFRVDDVGAAYASAIARGATAVRAPWCETDAYGTVHCARIAAYGDTTHTFVDRSEYRGAFGPGFAADALPAYGGAGMPAVGLTRFDHIVGNVEEGSLTAWERFYADVFGFTPLVSFSEEQISTEYSALRSTVMTNGSTVFMPINEPAPGRRRSQIEEYLQHYRGPGVQHLAMRTEHIGETVAALRARGLRFMDVPEAYYAAARERLVGVDLPWDDLARHRILVDRDDQGYLLQIFTEMVTDRPAVFCEVIERHGAVGFGEGNFKALFESIEREQARRGNL